MRTENEMIAYALETPPELLPHIPELLADLDELGSDAELITQVLSELELPASARIIDLGCGKGATAVEIAEELGLQVLGVELFAPFVDSCRALAAEADVSALCQFVQGDIVKLAGTLEPADVIVFAALGDVLGRLDETVAIIRRYVKPGGLILISDVFIREGGTADFPGFERYAEHAETRRRLTACGDEIIREVLESSAAEDPETEAGRDIETAADAEADEEMALIQARAAALAERHPEQAERILTFVASQAAENAYIEAQLIGAVWVMRRGS